MAEPTEIYQIHLPQTADTREALREIVRQVNEILLRVSEEIAKKQDA